MWYTGQGDEGYTGLIGGERIEKDAPRISVLGDLDEAISAIGVARAFAGRAETGAALVQIQRELSALAGEVASPEAEKIRIVPEMVAALEAGIADLEAHLQKPPGFIVPGDSRGAATLDLARAVVRRAERSVVALVHHGDVRNTQLIRYLNRLSSLLYLLARAEDLAAGVEQPTLMQP